jgi:ABC-2 type transport system ATP-binding protein
MTSAILRVAQVHKSYASKPALRGVSLDLHPGEFVALLGPNGAGKSTLFQILSGLFTADEGTVEVCGHNMAHNATRALARIGVVFQQPALDLDLSVQGNLRFHARLHGLGNRTAPAIAQALHMAGLEEQAQAKARSLSGGMRRRVEMVRALLHAPAVLLMDEATVGLDPASRQRLLADVRERCQRDGLSVLWATHLVEEAHAADRVLILHQGRVIAAGSPAALCQQHQQEDLESVFLHLTHTQASPCTV